MSTQPATRPEVTVEFEDPELVRQVFGQQDENLRTLEQLTGLKCHPRGTHVTLRGEPADLKFGARVLDELYDVARRGIPLPARDVARAIEALNRDSRLRLVGLFNEALLTNRQGKRITPRSPAQRHYIDAIRERDLVFGIGPAGTGKTYLAMVMAIRALLSKEVQRIILCRPAVEAGEKLGFLPGDLIEKVNPYLRPLHDALQDLLNASRLDQLTSSGALEIAPLAFMRGRTLNNAFVILDEAQNTTRQQMKMFLTRLGFDSKAVVTGDITQIDLPSHRRNGLTHAQEVLADVDGIEFCRFTELDVVRHPLVQQIVTAYDQAESRQAEAEARRLREDSK